MMRWVVTFLAIALVSALLGFTGLAVEIAEIAKTIFYIFIVLFIATLVMHLLRKSR